MRAAQAPLCQANFAATAQCAVIPMGSLGAELVGFFDTPLTSAKIDNLRVALAAHKMIVIRNQQMTPAQQIILTKIFGSELQMTGPSLRHIPDHPEIFHIANQAGHGNVNAGQCWHSDGHYLAAPSPVSVMYIVSATADGATLITDTARAYKRLSYSKKSYFAGLFFLNKQTDVAHPAVIKHPLTGEFNLYVNMHAALVDRSGRPEYEAREFLLRHLAEPDTYYSHQWRPGDTLIVDNFASSHCDMAPDNAQLQVMHRTSVTGESVWWRNAEIRH